MKTCSLILFFIFIVSCKSETPQPLVFTGNAQGTTFNITYFDEANFDAQKGIDSIFRAVDKSMSTYLQDSDISKINSGDSTVVVDDMFAEVFNISKIVHQESEGYFDPTVGKLVNLYGFGPEKNLIKIDSITIDSLMQYVGFGKVKLSPDNKIIKSVPNLYMDFNAIAQGYTVDRLALFLESKGIKNYLVEVGGELLAKGKNLEKNKTWSVGIDDPQQESGKREFSIIVNLKNKALATSGNYRKFRIDSLTGKKYVHTLNPLTGSAEMSDVTSATVVAPTCALADAYATAFMALGLEKSKILLENLSGIDAHLTYTNAENETGVFVTEGIKKLIAN